jgi:hypothetical protein
MRRVIKAAAMALAAVAAVGGGVAWFWLRGPAPAPPPSPQRLQALTAERDALQQRLREIVVQQGEKSLAQAPRAGVMIGIPTSLTASIVEQVVTGLFGETTLTLKNLKVHKEGEVKAKMLIRKKRIGKFVLDVDIHQVQGLLKPGKPTLGFGRGRVNITLPVRLAEGQGSADLRFQWDSKGLAANLVCGDVDVTRAVSGHVVPEDYTVVGEFGIKSAGEVVVLTPRFPDLAVRIYVDPSEQAWGVVDGVIRDRSKGCEIALNKVDVKAKLAQILGKGFNVKVPQKIFKPVRLPAGVSQSLNVQGIQLALQVKPAAVLVAEDRLWYGADISVSSKPASPRPPAGR